MRFTLKFNILLVKDKYPFLEDEKLGISTKLNPPFTDNKFHTFFNSFQKDEEVIMKIDKTNKIQFIKNKNTLTPPTIFLAKLYDKLIADKKKIYTLQVSEIYKQPLYDFEIVFTEKGFVDFVQDQKCQINYEQIR